MSPLAVTCTDGIHHYFQSVPDNCTRSTMRQSRLAIPLLIRCCTGDLPVSVSHSPSAAFEAHRRINLAKNRHLESLRPHSTIKPTNLTVHVRVLFGCHIVDIKILQQADHLSELMGFCFNNSPKSSTYCCKTQSKTRQLL